MAQEICPVACPVCGESQNTLPGNFNPDTEPFGPVHCMVCGHVFGRDEYLRGLQTRRLELDTLTGPDLRPGS